MSLDTRETLHYFIDDVGDPGTLWLCTINDFAFKAMLVCLQCHTVVRIIKSRN